VGEGGAEQEPAFLAQLIARIEPGTHPVGVLAEDRDDVAMTVSESMDHVLQPTLHVGFGERRDALDDARRSRLDAAAELLAGDEEQGDHPGNVGPQVDVGAIDLQTLLQDNTAARSNAC
jgi:hypothetical protein